MGQELRRINGAQRCTCSFKKPGHTEGRTKKLKHSKIENEAKQSREGINISCSSSTLS
jgi:hypothetical protein